ncbi:LLM class flavin-dependent oxidoreductase [Nonomuraea sp. NPDC050328]|uniref:LLM class flavin-dependent oxidoreductase n=1 Tax=Nonomuraea sp. NPDC050328 TaxID=3364361 RepID=UPI0037A90084
MTRASIILPIQPGSAAAARRYAGLVKRGVARRLWLGQSLRADTGQLLAGCGVPVGTSVTLMPLKHPLQAAVDARSLAALTGHPVVAGFGASSPEFVAALTGRPYDSPVREARAYLTTVRELIDGGELRGFRLPPLEHPAVEVGAGVLRPAMARAAADCADVAITWLTPPAYLREVIVPILRAGARRPRLVTVVHAALDRPGRDPARLAGLAAGHHLNAPHYADMLARAGVAAAPDALVASGVFQSGTAGGIAARLGEYVEAGVDELVVNTAGVCLADGPTAALAEAEEILEALRDHT